MNTYSRALRHINMKDVKQKHQQKLIEQKIQEEKRKEEEKYIASIMEEKKYDWRNQIHQNKKQYFKEGMTSSDMFFTTLPAQGNVDLENPPISLNGGNYPGPNGAPWTWNASVSGNSVILSGDPSPSIGNNAGLNFDASKYDTLIFDLSISSATSEMNYFELWSAGNESYTYASVNGPASRRTLTIPLQKIDQVKNLLLIFDSYGNATVTISNLRFQRRTPMNVFVDLNSPEATAFIRTDPAFAGLSPEQRLQKLREMLEASNEYVLKMFGEGFPGTGAVLPGEAGDTPGVEVTNFDTSKMEKDYGQVAGLSGIEIETLANIVLSSPTGQTRTNALDQLKQHIRPGSNNANKLKSMGINLGI